MTSLFTSESVSLGHPDKVADRISDAILDAYLETDPTARVAVESLVTTKTVVIAGEVRSNATPDIIDTVKKAIEDIGYTGDDFSAKTVNIINKIHMQSPEISRGVDSGGAGDQGLMFGYATYETDAFMPAPIHYSHQIMQALSNRRYAGDTRLAPDGKCQLTLTYENQTPIGVHTAVISHQHNPHVSQQELHNLFEDTLQQVLPDGWLTQTTKRHFNPTGSFVTGGPTGDTGLTGRKIIVDTYGGMARHGGGAFSGKDATKVDRSAAYAARYLAKNVVAAGLAHRCEIQLSYAIGIAAPLAIYVDTFGTGDDITIAKKLSNSIDLTPTGIITHLNLNTPIYTPTSSYGHFGRTPDGDFFPWERLNLIDMLT